MHKNDDAADEDDDVTQSLGHMTVLTQCITSRANDVDEAAR